MTTTNAKNALQLVETQMPEQKNVVAEYRGIAELDRVPELLNRGQQIKIENENQVDEIKEAREIRLDLKHARVAVDNRRKKLKEDIVRRGKAYDGVANILKDLIVPVENHLDNQEKFVERLEEKRLSALAESRIGELNRYNIETQFYNLRQMSDQGYAQLLESSRIAHAAKQAAAKKTAEEQAARENAEAEERAKTALENERLKAEAATQARVSAQRQAEADAKLNVERQAREKAEAEARKIKEAKERDDRAETERQETEKRAQQKTKEKARRAPDKEKLQAVAITAIEFPRVQSDAALVVVNSATQMLSNVSAYIKDQINKM